ncbi:MAG: PD-(D/E)XK nuclease family protein [Oscillospiraceae bacterium]|nr:PD-(D/E)XK nuclease family protein [Oscillospiraceae bacterium]
MLQLVLGRSGYGKTAYIHQRLAADATAGRPVVLLVPEQNSFESERAMLRLLGLQGASGVQILSFTRLADRILREIGGRAGKPMDDTVRTLLMSRALESVAGRLTLYHRQNGDPDYIQALLTLEAECKQYCVAPEQLSELGGGLPEDDLLRGKLLDFSLILGAYEAFTANAYADPADLLSILAGRMVESGFLAGAAVYVDGFKSFTAQEIAVLGGVMRQAAAVTVTLCTDTVDAGDTADPYGLFAVTAKTAGRLTDLAHRQNIPVAAPVRLEQNLRAATAGLRALEAGCFAVYPETVEGSGEQAVRVGEYPDIFAESAGVAREIRRLMRREGIRCRDIAVVARNLPDYEGILDAALRRAGIPCYIDARADILTNPLIVLLRAALACVTAGWDTGLLLRMMKTGLLGFSTRSCAEVENYVFTWRTTGSGWRREWADHPDGLSAVFSECHYRQLFYINLLRRRLIRPLETLAAALRQPLTGLDFARALCRYLEQVKAPRLLRLQMRRLDAAGEPGEADHLGRVWDLLMELLDNFGSELSGSALPAARLSELFSLAAQGLDLGRLPQYLDAVQIGSADRIRFAAPKIVWILGANEGVFPAYPDAAGLLSERERRIMAGIGLELADTGDGRVMEERLLAYLAAAAPSERLYISYLGRTGGGEPLVPSSLVYSVRRILPDCGWTDEEPVESEADGFDRLAALMRTPSVEMSSLRWLFSELPAYRPRLEAMDRALEGKPAAFSDTALAEWLFGRRMHLSASRVEAFYRCRFAYFCRYGLRAKARRTAELDALEFGTVVHYVMEQLIPVYCERGLPSVRREQVQGDAEARVHDYVTEYMGGWENKPGRFTAQARRLGTLCGHLLWHTVCELAQSRFVPAAFELPIGGGQNGKPGIEPYLVTLPDGGQVLIEGKIDRVDLLELDGARYVRVIDYKTGAKQFRLDEVAAGINLQLLIYLFAAGRRESVCGGEPAGMLYLPARLPLVKVDRPADPDDVAARQIKTMRMSGLLINNEEVLRAMEPGLAGLYIPAKAGKSGALNHSDALATLTQFGQLKLRMEQLLADMAQTLLEGDVAAEPLTGLADSCGYCDYGAVCGYEPGQPAREVPRRRAGEVWEELGAPAD